MVKEKLRALTTERTMEQDQAEMLQAHLAAGETIPLELRELHLRENLLQALVQYETNRFEGPVTLFAAEEVWWMYAHVGQDRGWLKYIPQLEIIPVPGDHDTMVTEPNIQVLGSYLRGLLLASVSQPVNQ